MKKFLLSVILSVFMCVSALATTIVIPGDYQTIQEGINSSSDGDTVLVMPHTYCENINFNGHNIVLGSRFLVTGDTSCISTTIINGGENGRPVVTFVSGEDSTAMLVGFTICHGFGGVNIRNSNPQISNNLIQANQNIDGGGGGVYCRNSNSVICQNRISDNTTPGIICHDASPKIYRNIVKSNSLGMYCKYNSKPLIENNTFVENGGGLYVTSGISTVVNSIFWGNSGFEIDAWGDAIINVNYCDIQDTLCPGDGNISVNPLFRDSENGDFHLMAIECGDSLDSPCIDVGHPTTRDFTNVCSWGLGTAHGDIGAYGGGLINNSPVLDLISPQLILEGYTLNFLVTASDLDFDQLGLFAEELPTNAIFTDFGDGSGLCSFSPDYSQAGIYEVLFVASDGYFADSLTVRVTVLGAGNQPPQIASIDSQTTTEGTHLEFLVVASDPDSTIPVLCGFYLPANAAFTDSGNGNGLFTFDPDFEQAGIYEVLFTASDEDFTDSLTVQITVRDSVLCGVGDKQGQIPTQFALRQNHSNPFNARTVISYELPTRTYIKLEVYNIFGQKLITLVNDRENAGYKSVTWDASSVSSGVYFYKLVAGDFVEVKRMTLLR